MVEAAQQEQPAIMMVQVTNHLDRDLNDMFNGIPITFPVGKPVDISTDVAAHCFGWPGEDDDRARHMATRYGWGTRENLAWLPGTRKPQYFEWAMKIEIKPIYFDLVRRNPNDPIPADDGKEPDDLPPSRIEAEAGPKAGKRNRKALPPRRLRDRHATAERVR